MYQHIPNVILGYERFFIKCEAKKYCVRKMMSERQYVKKPLGAGDDTASLS